MKSYFNIRYEFDKTQVHNAINNRLQRFGSDYICVADGNILTNVYYDFAYRNIVNNGMFSICDSSYVPLFIRLIYRERYSHYCGSEIFEDIVKSKKYRMIFLGTSNDILIGLKENLCKLNPDISDMKFIELPYLGADEFDYESIAKMISDDKSDIIWVALGAPKQEKFMAYLKSYLNHGVMIAVGAAFKFYSNTGEKRAPNWILKYRLEFIYRLFQDPKKQSKRCWATIKALPYILYDEIKQKNINKL
jgi:N-acetylglucosaminyldiphosphoundecaprenol N-acetyl-beta-D-mannosaminyltransferase